MAKRLLLFIFVAFAVVASAMGQGSADFAFPRKVSAEALTQLDKALKSGDGNAVVNALVRYSLAESSISKQNVDTIMSRIEHVARQEGHADTRALIYYLAARLLDSYVTKYGAVAIDVDSVPSRYERMSKPQIAKKINELVLLSLRDEKLLKTKHLSDYPGIITTDTLGLYPSLYHFLALQGYKMSNNNDVLLDLLESCQKGSLAHINVIVNSTYSSVHNSILNIDEKKSVLPEYYKLYKDRESSGLLIKHMRPIVGNGEQYITKFPNSPFTPEITNMLYDELTKKVDVELPTNCSTRDTIKVGLRYIDNLDNIKLTLYRLNDTVNYIYNKPLMQDQLTLVETIDVTIDKENFTNYAYFQPQGYGRYVVIPSFLNDYGEMESGVGKINIKNYLTISDVALMVIEQPVEKIDEINKTQEQRPLITNKEKMKYDAQLDLIAVDVLTGKPVEGAVISEGDWQGVTDSDGVVKRIMRKGIDPKFCNYNVAISEDRWMFTNKSFYRNGYNVERTDTVSKIFTDLAIYRPGEEVKFVAVNYSVTTKKRTLLKNFDVKVVLEDANSQPIDSMRLVSDQWGRVTGKFTLPKELLNGRFTIKILCDNYCIGSRAFDVSEYKIPTFSVTLDDMRDYYLGEDVVISGAVADYGGMPVVGAEVTLNVESNTSFWREDDVEISDTTLITDADGRFTLTMPASMFSIKPDDDYDPSDEDCQIEGYTVNVIVENELGEEHDAVDVFNLILQGKTSVDVIKTRYCLTGVSDKLMAPIIVKNTLKDNAIIYYRVLDAKSKVVKKGILQSNDLMIDFRDLPSGNYTFEAKTKKDKTYSSNSLLLYRLDDMVCYIENTPMWIVPEGTKVNAANQGEVLIGTSVAESHIYYIASTSNRILKKGWLHYGPGMHKLVLDMPATQGEWVNVEFLNIYNKKKDRDRVRLQSLYPPVLLNVKIESFRNKLVPGEKEKWTFSLVDNDSVSHRGGMMLSMIDKAIYDLSRNEWRFAPTFLYNNLYDCSVSNIDGYFSSSTSMSWTKQHLVYKPWKTPELYTYGRKFFGSYFSDLTTLRAVDIDPNLHETIVAGNDKVGWVVKGAVYGEDLEPLIGASVSCDSVKTITDIYGRFSITVPRKDSEIKISYIGAVTYILFPKDLPVLIIMPESAEGLDEVVVTKAYGYTNVDKRLFTGTTTSILEVSGTFGTAPTIRVQGATTGASSSKPLIIVDGVIIDDVEFDINALNGADVARLLEGAVSGLSASDITDISVLRDASATSIYGARATNGVVVINTASKSVARDRMMQQVKSREQGVKTALWEPLLTTDDEGHVAVEFTAPENNSTWIVQAIAYNSDLVTGRSMGEVVTSRPLMVKPVAPRFLRHGDSVTLKAKVQNADDTSATVSAIVELFDMRNDAVLHSVTQELSIAPQETKEVEIDWQVPDSLALVGMRVKAATERWGDGEQMVIPVLEAASPVIETQPFYIDPGEEKTLTVPSYSENAHITLETCENPLWYAVMALPTIYSDNDKVASCVAHSLFAQSVAQDLSGCEPEIAQAIRSWKGDSTVVSMLQQNSSLKIGDLMASPFVGAAQRETLRMRQLSNLLDTTKMDSEHERLVTALGKLQQSDGGWTWFSYPGCESSLYTTMGVLELIGEQMLITTDISDDELNKMAEKGVLYCDSVIVNRFTKGESIDYMGYAYVRSMFPNVEMGKKNKAIHDRSVKEIVAKWKDRSLIDRAYAAIVLYRNGKKDEARKIAQSLREFAITDNQGMHWDNLQEGYAAFYDKVTLTATVLEALSLVDPRQDEMAQIHKWMLLMKQSNDWGSSSLAAHAVYALLTTDGGNKWLTDSLGYSIREIAPNETIKFDKKNHPQWGAVYSAYSAPMADIQAFKTDDLSVTKNFIRYGKDGELEPFTTLDVGDKVQVRITLDARKDLDYITVTDERAACFEPVDKVSGYKWGEVFYYNEVKDSKTNLFITSLRKGVHTVTYDVMLTNIGTYASGIASAQCQYSPQVTAHTAATVIEVK
ncbi:MAG: TonB-dependent receptor plug domain-containing protein [Muribaculaceae bacterium]|nr:TonB-dependent receptor plug domain-containing protein [Muribaculaceae bacterium]